MPSAVDAFVAYKFVQILSRPWEETDAYKLGIIDEKGKLLKKQRQLKTQKEKRAYTIFHRLCWNIKRLLDRLPPTRTRLGSFASALWLLKEHAEVTYGKMDDGMDAVIEFLNEAIEAKIDGFSAYERMLFEEEMAPDTPDSVLKAGRYMLLGDVDTPVGMARAGTEIVVPEDLEAFGEIAGAPVFNVNHPLQDGDIVVSHEDIRRIGPISESYDSDADMRRAEMYFEIGHEEEDSIYIVVDNKPIIHSGKKQRGSHGMSFPRLALVNSTEKGWIDHEKSIISIVGGHVITQDPSPQRVRWLAKQLLKKYPGYRVYDFTKLGNGKEVR